MKKKKILKIITIILAAVILAAVIAVALINTFIVTGAKKYFLSPEEAAEQDFDCILVLGSLVYQSGNMSPILKNRVEMGIKLYFDGASDRVLMSGDHGNEDYDEVNAMKNFAVNAGIDPDHVFMDHAGFSTYESVYRARDIFKCKKILIVTQKYHLSRAVYLARSLGLDAYGVPSDTYAEPSYDLPKPLLNHSREVLARIKAFGSAIFKPIPDIMGEPIPISGKGSATDG